MAGERRYDYPPGWFLDGERLILLKELVFQQTDNPEISSTGGPFRWITRQDDNNSFTIEEETTGNPIFAIDTLNKKVTILAPYNLEVANDGFASTIPTADATPTLIKKIDNLIDDSIHYIEVRVTAKSSDDLEWGVWFIGLSITKIGGVVAIRQVDVISHDSSAGLVAGSVSFAANAGDLDSSVTGIIGKNIQWDFLYKIPVLSTN